LIYLVKQHLKYGLGWPIEEHDDLGIINYHDGLMVTNLGQVLNLLLYHPRILES